MGSKNKSHIQTLPNPFDLCKTILANHIIFMIKLLKKTPVRSKRDQFFIRDVTVYLEKLQDKLEKLKNTSSESEKILIGMYNKIAKLDDTLLKKDGKSHSRLTPRGRHQIAIFLSENKLNLLAGALILIGITLMLLGPLGLAPAIAVMLKTISIIASHQAIVVAGYAVAGAGTALILAVPLVSSLFNASKKNKRSQRGETSPDSEKKTAVVAGISTQANSSATLGIVELDEQELLASVLQNSKR